MSATRSSCLHTRPSTQKQILEDVLSSLRKQGIGQGDLVGLCAERSAEMVIGLLGILKAGGAYLPLDPTHPQERLAIMLADTQASVILTRQNSPVRYRNTRPIRFSLTANGK